MPRFGRDGKRIVQHMPEPGPPGGLPGVIDGLTVSFRELNEKRDRLEGDVDKFRRRLAEAEGELDQLQRSWWPSQLDTKQRLEQYRDKLRAHLGAVSSELDLTKASIPAARAALVRHYAVAQASRRPVEALTVPCPACGQASVPHRTAAAGWGWRKGWYECPADDCDAAWSARWSSGVHPAVRMVGLLILHRARRVVALTCGRRYCRNQLSGLSVRATCRCCGVHAWSAGPCRVRGRPPGRLSRVVVGAGCGRRSTRRPRAR